MNRKFNRSERGSLWYKSRCCVGIWQREMFTKSKNLSQFARCAGWYYKRVIRNTKSDPAYRVQTTQLTAKQNSNNTNSKYLQVFRQYMKILRLRQMFLYWHKTYRVIHMSLRNFRPLQYRSRDGHAEGEHVNRGRHSKFLSYLTGARYFHPWWRGKCQSSNQVPATRVWQELDYRIDICRVAKVGHIENL